MSNTVGGNTRGDNEKSNGVTDRSSSENPADHTPESLVASEGDIEATRQAKPAPLPFNPADFPDGGLTAWLVVFGSWLCLVCSFGFVNCIGVFQTYYEQERLSSYSPSTIAWIPSMETFMMFSGGLVFGKIFDSYGPRYMLLFGSVLHVFGLMMTSLSTKYYQIFLSQGVVSGLGTSAIFYSGVSCSPTWFFKKRATALGIVASGASIGGVIFPILVNHLIPQVGFGWTMRITAFLIGGLLIVANFTVKSRLPHKPSKIDVMNYIQPLKELPFFFVVAGAFMFFFGTFLPFNYIILQARSKGMSERLSNYLIPMLNAASTFGRILPGILADRIGNFNVMIGTCLVSGILVLGLWIPSSNNAAIIMFAILYGFFSGAFGSMSPALVAQVSPIKQIGVRVGTMFTCVAFAALTGNPIGGALVTRNDGKFTYLEIFCGVSMLVGTVLFYVARSFLVKKAIFVKV